MSLDVVAIEGSSTNRDQVWIKIGGVSLNQKNRSALILG